MRAGGVWDQLEGRPPVPHGASQDQAIQGPMGLLGWWPLPGPIWPDCRPPEDPGPRGSIPEPGTRGSPGRRRAAVPGNSQHVCLSQSLDREDLWARFAILFSVRVINQPHAHSGCSAGLRRAHWRSHTHTHTGDAAWPQPDVPGRGRSSRLREERNLGNQWLPGRWDPRPTQNQGLRAGRQGAPGIGEAAITQVMSRSSAACLAASKSRPAVSWL